MAETGENYTRLQKYVTAAVGSLLPVSLCKICATSLYKGLRYCN